MSRPVVLRARMTFPKDPLPKTIVYKVSKGFDEYAFA